MEIKDYNLMVAARNFFDRPIKNDLETYDNIRMIETGPGDDYTTECLLNDPYFKKRLRINVSELKQTTKISR